jgi:pimeloyl-ACP methyl ester carboxylesterase
VETFYRELGLPEASVILLLHCFSTSSHMFRNLIPELASHYRVIAPDLPGFGNTIAPARGRFDYPFDNIARVIREFVDTLGLTRCAMYVCSENVA